MGLQGGSSHRPDDSPETRVAGGCTHLHGDVVQAEDLGALKAHHEALRSEGRGGGRGSGAVGYGSSV